MNKKPEIIAFLMHLGTNNWRKKDYNDGTLLDDEDFIYRDEMFCNKEVWKKVTDHLPDWGINTLVIDVSDGVVYDRHPDISIPGAWTKAELKEELDRLRGMGITPIPKCNFSNGHSAWLKNYAYMVGTKLYDDICKDIVEELIELFDKPAMFHLGLEEEDYKSQEGQPVAIVRNPDKKSEDANKLFDICISNGVRPWIWANQHTIDAFGGDEMFVKRIPKDVIITNYSYGMLRYNDETEENYVVAKCIRKCDNWGYDQIPCGSTWSWHLANKDLIRFCKNNMDTEKIIGFMSAPWMLTTQNKYYQLLADAYNLSCAVRDIMGE